MLETIDKSEIIKVVRKRTKTENGYVNHINTRCYICKRNETRILPNGRPHWLSYKVDKNGKFDSNGNWDRKSYICAICYDKEHRKLPDSDTNLIKSMRKFRNKELSKDCSSGKAFIGEQIWCKARGVDNCNIKMDNFAYKYDHPPDPEYGITNTKIASLSHHQGTIEAWQFSPSGKYNYVVLICMSKDWKDVDRIYIIPESEAKEGTSITISKNPYRGIPWYEKYRVDEKPYNEAYHSLSIEDCSVLKDD